MLYPKGLFAIMPSTGLPQNPGLPLPHGSPAGSRDPGTPSPVRAQGSGERMAGGWGRFPGRAAAMPPKVRAGVHPAESRDALTGAGSGLRGDTGLPWRREERGGADGAAPGAPPASPEVAAPVGHVTRDYPPSEEAWSTPQSRGLRGTEGAGPTPRVSTVTGRRARGGVMTSRS